MKRLKRMLVFCLMFILLFNIIGCASKNSYATDIKRNGPWTGDLTLSWDSNSLILRGNLNYNSEVPIKEVTITPDYKETALGLPEGYVLPYMRAKENYNFENKAEVNLQIFDKAKTYKKVSKLLTTDQAKKILNNLTFKIEFTDINNRRDTIYLVCE